MLASPIPGTVPAYVAAKKGVHHGLKKLKHLFTKQKQAMAGGSASAYLPRGPSGSDLAQWSASMRLGKKGLGKKSEIAADGLNKESMSVKDLVQRRLIPEHGAGLWPSRHAGQGPAT